MDIASNRSWKLRVASSASWLVAICVCFFSVVSIVRIGVSVGNLCILGVGLAQLAINKAWRSVGYRIAGVEMVGLVFISIPFYFAFRESSGEIQLPLWWRVSMFGIGTFVLMGVAGICLAEAATVSASTSRR